jgi:hypothetical protein
MDGEVRESNGLYVDRRRDEYTPADDQIEI